MLLLIAALGLLTALGLWLWADQQSREAGVLESAQSCTWAGESDCMQAVSVTSEGTSTSAVCWWRGGCQNFHVLRVLFPDGHTDDLQIASGRIPAREFDQGQPLTAEEYNGVVETVQGPFATVLRTLANPAARADIYHMYALIVAGAGAGLLSLSWLFGRQSSRAVPVRL